MAGMGDLARQDGYELLTTPEGDRYYAPSDTPASTDQLMPPPANPFAPPEAVNRGVAASLRGLGDVLSVTPAEAAPKLPFGIGTEGRLPAAVANENALTADRLAEAVRRHIENNPAAAKLAAEPFLSEFDTARLAATGKRGAQTDREMLTALGPNPTQEQIRAWFLRPTTRGLAGGAVGVVGLDTLSDAARADTAYRGEHPDFTRPSHAPEGPVDPYASVRAFGAALHRLPGQFGAGAAEGLRAHVLASTAPADVLTGAAAEREGAQQRAGAYLGSLAEQVPQHDYWLDRYARAAGVPFGNPLNTVGVSAAPMIMGNLASSAGGETMRHLYEGTRFEPWAQAVGSLTPMAAERALTTGRVGIVRPVEGAAGIIGGRLKQPQRRMGEVADQAAYEPAPIGHNNPPPDVTGSLNPLDNIPVTFRGKAPAQMTPDEITAWGAHYGVPNLGTQSAPQTFKDLQGNSFNIPGGIAGKWTHADLLSMKANPINPANIDRSLHIEMQKKLGRTMTPDPLTDADVWNGLVFGMTSPNNPLFPNQTAASRMRLRTPEMLDDLASMIPWKPGDQVSTQARKLVNDQIAARFGLQAEEKGGLGARGTADYSRLGELAQMFKQNPQFFRKQPNEDWLQAVERISSQVPGLSMKTGSFGTVWQDPAMAGISAIDRHMARELDKRPGGIFAGPDERTHWENQSVGRWNKREADRVAEQVAANRKLKPKDRAEVQPPDLATDFSDLLRKRGSDGFMGEMLLDHVGAASQPRFRYATGNVNPNLPAHLAQAQWVREPQNVLLAGRAYKQALDVNQQIANQSGLPLFMSQWMEWDRIRNRFEPHENMFPGLPKLPAQSIEQLRAVDAAHRMTGHKTYGKSDEGTLQPTKPFAGNPFQMGLYGVGGAGLMLPNLSAPGEEQRVR